MTESVRNCVLITSVEREIYTKQTDKPRQTLRRIDRQTERERRRRRRRKGVPQEKSNIKKEEEKEDEGPDV